MFAELSGNTLRLERFFAKQSLSNARFAGRLPRDGQYYYPFILTDEGSTFVFKLAEMGDVSKAQDIVQTWLHHGIPLARTLASGFGPISDPDWKKCPILDRHGFGEITVNSPWLCNSKEIDKPIKLQD